MSSFGDDADYRAWRVKALHVRASMRAFPSAASSLTFDPLVGSLDDLALICHAVPVRRGEKFASIDGDRHVGCLIHAREDPIIYRSNSLMGAF
eukprot:COSAG02_NODE_83_length_39665_cov_25.213719_36_plen_93_part_00